MWGLIVELGILGLDATINYLNRQDPPPPPKALGLQMPTVEDGAPYPIIYGRTRVRKPILAWQDTPVQVLRSAGAQNFYDYYLSMHFVLGLGFLDGQQNIWNIWAGDTKMRQFFPFPSTATGLGDLVGDGFFEDQTPQFRFVDVSIDADPNTSSQVLVTGQVEFLNGNSSQLLVHDSSPYYANTHLAEHMTVAQTVGDFSTYGGADPRYMGSYRGLMSVFLHGGGRTGHWYVGTQTQVQTYSFEVSSYPSGTGYPSQGMYGKISTDANPADVLYDILTGTRGKLGLDPSLIDMASFQAVAHTLWTENNGYSRAIEDLRTAADIISEILKQIDATLFEDPTTGLIALKLIRNDYDPTTILTIDKTNCTELRNIVSTGWVNIPNKIRVTFSDEINDYNQGSVTAQNLANAVGQDGLVNEVVIDMPGVTRAEIARYIAQRELAALSRPQMSCTALVDRTFIGVRPGDVVKVVLTDPDIPGVVFRVVAANHGTIASGTIQLDLVADTFFVWRNTAPVNTGFGGHDAGGRLLTSG